MRYAFQAIDENGRVLRGVMRAESEEEAREILLDENVFPKTLEPAEEGAKVTWVPKGRIKAQFEKRGSTTAAEETAKPARAILRTTMLLGHDNAPVGGRAGLTEEDGFAFEGEKETRVSVPREEVELAEVAGFPAKVLRVTLLSGRMLEFSAGMIFAQANAKLIAQTLSPKKRKKK